MAADPLRPARIRLRRAHHHEIRGSLNAMRLQLTLLQQERSPGAEDDDAGQEARWLAALADEVSSVEAGVEALSAVERIEEMLAAATPAQALERIAALLAPLAKTERVQLVHESAGDPDFSVRGMARPLLGLGALGILQSEPDAVLTLRATERGFEMEPGLAESGDAPSPDPRSWLAGEAGESWSLGRWDQERIVIEAMALRAS